jgi:hypothetical protein
VGITHTCARCQAQPPTSPVYLLHQQALEFPSAVLHALAVCAVHHPDEAVGALKVVPPIGAQGLLAAHVPDIQLESGGVWEAVKSQLPHAHFSTPGQATQRPPHPRCSRVLMLKPSVGEMVSTSSPLNFLRMVVLPALSRPLGSRVKESLCCAGGDYRTPLLRVIIAHHVLK